MPTKQSKFTEIEEVPSGYYFDTFSNSVNRKISKEKLFEQLRKENSTFIYKTEADLIAANLEASEDQPIYVRCEATGYRLYKITSQAAGVDDIELANGATATFQVEDRGEGFVFGPSTATDGNLAAYDGATGKVLKDGPAISSFATSEQGAKADSAVQPAAIEDMVEGPESSTTDTLAVFNGTTGKRIKGGGPAVSDVVDVINSNAAKTFRATVGLSQIGTIEIPAGCEYAVFPYDTQEGDGIIHLRKDNAATADFSTDAGGNKWIDNGPGYPSVVTDAPYVSMKEKLKASALNFVADFKAPDDGTGNCSDAFKEFLEFGAKRLDIPDGIFNFSDAIVIHDKSGLDVRGFGQELTKLTADTSLLLDTSELSALPISYQSEYNKNALFHVTAYDGENGRVDKAARNTFFRDLIVDFEGTPGERLASLIATPQFAWAEFHNIKMHKALSLLECWITSGLDSRFYHLFFNGIRSEECVHHIKQEYVGSGIVQQGTSWTLINNSMTKCDRGYELQGLNYSHIIGSSVDNQKQGAYALDVYSCKDLTVTSCGIETRYRQAGEEYGGGIFRVREGSVVNMIGGFAVGGDRDGTGTGAITDYDDGSGTVNAMYIVSDSVMSWSPAQVEVLQNSSSGSDWPVHVVSGGYLEYKQGNEGFGGVDSHFTILGTSRVKRTDSIGNETFLAGPSAGEFAKQTNIRVVCDDEVTLEAPPGATASDYDIFARLTDGTILKGVDYKVNLGNLGLGDYTTINFPTSAGPFGLLQRHGGGLYQYVKVTKNNGESYQANSSNGGSSWGAWQKLTP